MALKKIRVTLAVIFFTFVTLLFLDFTGTLHAWLGWTAKIQFLPALLALNVGVVAALVALTLIFGRIYCSVICPMGVFQDIISWINGRRGKKQRNRFTWSPAKKWLRYSLLGVFVIAIIAGIGSIMALLEPYSAYGRIVSNLFSPIWKWGNNLLAYFAERADSYAFYSTEVWMKSLPTFIIAALTLVAIFILAWRNGRTYCNTICPVGTILGFLSKYSIFQVRIDPEKCKECSLCTRGCKASCIDYKNHSIDHSRCVDCFNCLDNCKHGAISYTNRLRKKAQKPAETKVDPAPADTANVKTDSAPADTVNVKTDSAMVEESTVRETTSATTENVSRRNFLAVAGLVATTAALKADDKKVDGGLAVIEDKKVPERQTGIVPAGSLGHWHFHRHCTGCQLCVSVCPNQVLRPSTDLRHLMQPEMSYERGYCRPECTKCADVCPAGAIHPITLAEKSSIRIGHAVWVKENCIPLTDGVSCGNCARHCPAGAILMVPIDANDPESLKIPVVNEERCIGCGACENLCPARPFSAIYVEGHEVHSEA